MLVEKSLRKFVAKTAEVAVLVMCAFAALPGNVSGQGRVTDTLPLNFLLFVPCANGGAGELVSFTGEFHRVNEIEPVPDLIEHANWSMVSGTGLITGDRYVGASTSNRIPPVDDGTAVASYLVNTTAAGTGSDAAKFNFQQILRFAPFTIETIRVTCI